VHLAAQPLLFIVVEANRELAKRFGAQYGFRMDKVFSTMEQVINETRPEGVKAFGTIRQHLDVVRLADEYDIELLTNYETTWYPANHKSYEIISSGDLG